MVKNGDDTSYANHGEHGAEADAQKRVAVEKPDQAGERNAAKVKAVLAEAELTAAAAGDAVDNAVAGVRNQLHIDGHSGPDAGQEDAARKHQQIGGQKAAFIRNHGLEKVHEPGEHQAQRQLQQIQPAAIFPVDDHLRCKEQAVDNKRHIA